MGKARAAELAPDMSKYGTHKKITCDGCAIEPTEPNQQRINPISTKLEHHEWFCYAENGAFAPMSKAGQPVQTAKQPKKVKPNEPCSCGSGKKFKKCCQNK